MLVDKLKGYIMKLDREKISTLDAASIDMLEVNHKKELTGLTGMGYYLRSQLSIREYKELLLFCIE